MPRYPSEPGTTISSTSSRMSERSGVTISRFSFVGSAIDGSALGGLHTLGFFNRFLDRAHQVERLLRQIVVLALGNLLEATNCVGNRDVLALEARELFGDEERL